MTTYAFAGYTFGVTLGSLLDEARMLARLGSASTGYQHLGQTTTQQETRVAEFVNQTIEEVTEENPALGITQTTITLTAGDSGYGTTTYPIPATLFEAQIRKMYFQIDADAPEAGLREIPFWGPDKISQLAASWKNGQYTLVYPQGYSFDNTARNFIFYPTPDSSSVTLVLEFRAKPTVITQANVNSPDAVTLGEVPVRFRRVYALRVARDLLKPENIERWAEVDAAYRSELRRMQDTITTVLASDKAGRADDAFPNPVFNQSQFFRMGLLQRRRYGR